MKKQKKQLLQDVILITISIGFAFFLVQTDTTEKFIASLGEQQWLGIFLSGMFFTSIFTTAPSIALLGTFAQTTPLFTIAILGGLGAMLGDYIIFRLIRDRISSDFKYIFSLPHKHRLSMLSKTNPFKLLVPFLGALIILSPLPDEIGVMMMGISKINERLFLFLSFILNGTGIFIVAWIAQSVASLI